MAIPRVQSFLGLFLVAVCGCQTFSRPFPIEAVDAETGQPIVGAELHIRDHTNAVLSASPCDGKTGADGVARLRAAENAAQVEASAPGYLSETTHLSAAAVQDVPPAKLFEKVDRRPAALVVALYAGPDPTVELVAPTGYRGMVKAELKFSENTPEPGKRAFRYEVSATGGVQVVGPPLLRRLLPAEFRGRYADGTELKPNAQDDQIGFWWLRHEGSHDYFFIGTRGEFDGHRPSDVHPGSEGRAAGGSKGGHGSHRGHGGATGGDAPPSDPPQ